MVAYSYCGYDYCCGPGEYKTTTRSEIGGHVLARDIAIAGGIFLLAYLLIKKLDNKEESEALSPPQQVVVLTPQQWQQWQKQQNPQPSQQPKGTGAAYTVPFVGGLDGYTPLVRRVVVQSVYQDGSGNLVKLEKSATVISSVGLTNGIQRLNYQPQPQFSHRPVPAYKTSRYPKGYVSNVAWGGIYNLDQLRILRVFGPGLPEEGLRLNPGEALGMWLPPEEVRFVMNSCVPTPYGCEDLHSRTLRLKRDTQLLKGKYKKYGGWVLFYKKGKFKFKR